MNDDIRYLKRYLAVAPIPLGLIRAIDCRYLAGVEFKGSLLDVGCGDGLLAKILFDNEKGRIDAGIDASIAELDKARRTGMYRCLVDGDITKMPFPDERYDTVFSNSVLEHIPDLDAALSEINRVLKPGGRFACTVPSEYLSEQMLFPAIFRRIGLKAVGKYYSDFKHKAWNHYHLYGPAVWVDKLKAQGLDVVTHKYIHGQEITRLCDLFTFSGVISVVWRKLFGRLLLFPGRWRGAVLAGWLKPLYYLDRQIGSTIFIVAQKRKVAQERKEDL